MRTLTEVVNFLDGQVGKVPQHPAPYQDLSGQCVTGVKVLLDFLGVPNPYQARGNARDVGDALIRQGIGIEGKGSKLTIVINRDMGNIYEPSLGRYVKYGHIWMDVTNTANYESNGNRALYMTKNTRPITQGQQFINMDKWIGGNEIMDENDANALFFAAFHRRPGGNEAKQWVGLRVAKAAESIPNQPEWLTQNHFIAFFQQRENQLNDAMRALTDANAKLKAALDNDASDKKAIADAQKAAADASAQLTKVTEQYDKAKADYDAAKAREEQATATGNAFTRWLGEQLNKILGGK